MPSPPQQLSLWSDPAAAPPRRVRPAPMVNSNATLSRALSANVRFGTSSWGFPGWRGITYAGRHSPTTLAREGLWAYARHPLLRTVGLDRTHYAPLTAGELAGYAADVPAEFRFLVKAHEDATLARFPDHARFGRRAGAPNPRYLDPAYATDVVVGPLIAGLGDKAGPLLFQFARRSAASIGSPAEFAERLHRFLAALPRGPLYAVELRNPELVTPAYAQALAATGACHCLNVHRSMPSPATQLQRLGPHPQPALIVRWMLGPELDYQAAHDAWAPFDRIAQEDCATRSELVELCSRALTRAQPIYLIVNNKAEGCAPLSVMRLAEMLLERGG